MAPPKRRRPVPTSPTSSAVSKSARSSVRRRAAAGGEVNVIVPDSEGTVARTEVIEERFEEWMKLASDNKITSNNTWDLALIDYFADLSILRNSPTDSSINFQKASCTLDGCVKVWVSRVDSVGIEAGKLAGGLVDDSKAAGGVDDSDEDGGEGVGENAAEDADEEGKKSLQRKKALRGNTSTLAPSFASIEVKKLEQEFTVDPLFRKTCADFDEGGAQGLLMNHLGVDPLMRVVFDAGDVQIGEHEEEDDDNDDNGNEEGEEGQPKKPNTVVPYARTDLSKLQSAFIPNLDLLDGKLICPSLSSFRFSFDSSKPSINPFASDMPDDDLFPHAAGHNDARDEDWGQFGNDDNGAADIQDVFADHVMPDQAGTGFGDFAADFDADNDNYDLDPYAERVIGAGGIEAFNPTHPTDQRSLILTAQSGKGEESIFDYFDTGLNKNWAGPEHWKIKRLAPIRNSSSASVAKRGSGAKKEPFIIDFDSEPVSRKTLFTTASKASINIPLSKARPAKKRKMSASVESIESDEFMLPDDMHFSSKQLLRLFLKPRFALKMRKQTIQRVQGMDQVDENFWAQATAEAVRNDANNGFNDDGFDDDGGGDPFMNDPFDNDFGGDIGETAKSNVLDDEEDALLATQNDQLRKSRPIYVNYAKKAKRVDVSKLKDNIWTGLSLAEHTDTSAEDIKKPFSTVMSTLNSTYTDEKMADISTSFCFICLLHLANEHGLEVEQPGGQSQLEDTMSVGRLEQLNIWKTGIAGAS